MVILPYAATIAAAACFGTASVLQHLSAQRARIRDGLASGALNPLLLVRLGRQRSYLAGLALDAAGFALSVWALRTLPLFFVEAALASSLAFTAVLAAVAAGESLVAAERRAVAVVIGGLVLISASAMPAHGPSEASVIVPLLVGLPALLGAAALLDRHRHAAWSGVAFGALSGCAFAGFGIAGRELGSVPHQSFLGDPALWALLSYLAVGMLLFGAALQRGKVSTVTAANVVVETVLPAAVGVLVLGEGARPGFAAVAVAGFVLTTAAAVSLAREQPPIAAGTVRSGRTGG